jgi:hypothetical protein
MQYFGSGFIDSRYGSSILNGISIRIRIQGFDTKNLIKLTAGKYVMFFLSVGLQKGRPSYGRSLRPSEEDIEHEIS